MIAQIPVIVEVYDGAGVDDYGDEVDSWLPAEERLVYSWGPDGVSEPKGRLGADSGLNRAVYDMVLFAPWPLKAPDRVILSGKRYQVEGDAEDWNHGFHGWQPGFQINLRRVDG